MPLQKTYETLFRHYGRQHWWPGETAFEVMVGSVLTQNTAWTNVEKAIAKLHEAGAMEAELILKAPQRRVAAWIRSAGYFNVKAKRLRNFCAWYVGHGGEKRLRRLETVALRHELLRINGVGPETADDILLYAFHRPVFVIDAYTRRLFSRLQMLDGDEPYEEMRSHIEASLRRQTRSERKMVPLFNEYHALIVRHGKEICKPRPRCGTCRLARRCPAAES